MSTQREILQAAIERRQRLKLAGIHRMLPKLDRPTKQIIDAAIERRKADEERPLVDQSGFRTHPSLHEIIRAVCLHFGVSKTDLLSERRDHSVTHPRQVVCWIARELTPLSTLIIGRCINRDHTTVLSAVRKIDMQILAGHPIGDEAIELREKLRIATPKPYWGA